MICDIAMPRMNGLKLLEHIRNRGDQTPGSGDICHRKIWQILPQKRYVWALKMFLLKPVKDLNRLREMVFACLYPSMFNSRVEEEERLFRDWDAMVDNPLPQSAKLLQELQPPVQRVISHCRVNYRQLVAADKPGTGA